MKLNSLFHSLFHLTLKKPIVIMFSLILMACDQSQEVSVNDKSLDHSKNAPSASASLTLISNLNSDYTYGFDSEFNYPSFSGAFPVATMEMTVTDNSRLEIFSDKTETTDVNLTPRRFNIRFYYPSVETKLATTKKLPIISETAWANLIGPQIKQGKMLRYSNYKNAFWDIKFNQQLSDQQTDYPLLIFSHGYGYSPEAYSALSAELASQGYIVISINHTFGANPTKLQGENPQIQWAKNLPVENIGQNLPTWSDDQVFVIEELYRLNTEPSSPFYARLNLSQLGIFGHSYGGAAAYLTASRDPRIKAIMDIDGTLFEAGNFDVFQPFAFLLSKNHSPIVDLKKLYNDSFLIKFSQFEHISFTDHILWWQWDFEDTNLDMGNINSLEAVETTSSFVRAFFDAYLLNKDEQWNRLTKKNNFSRRSLKIK